MTTYMVRSTVSLPHLFRWAKNVRIQTGDMGYTIHAATRALWGEIAPQPFVWQEEKGQILGYAVSDGETLREVRNSCSREDAELLRKAFCLPEFCTKKMPEVFPAGQKFNFQVLCCPIRRQTSPTSGKKCQSDAWLGAVYNLYRGKGGAEGTGCPTVISFYRQHPDECPSPETVYKEWLTEQFTRSGGARVLFSNIKGSRTIRVARRPGSGAPVLQAKRSTPEVLFRGCLQVENQDAFSQILARGVGRHRAFGFGMLLLSTIC